MEERKIGKCDWYDMIKDFHIKFGHPASDVIQSMEPKQRQIRAKWMLDEVLEFATDDEVVGQAKELIDVIVFALGTLVEMGIDPVELFDAVHDSNMSKLGPDGKPKYDPITLKILKPATYMPAEHEISQILLSRMKKETDDIPF